jgi:hypothetical protein
MSGICSTHGKIISAYKIMVGRPKCKRLLGRSRCGWEGKKIILIEIECECVDWIHLIRNRFQRRTSRALDETSCSIKSVFLSLELLSASLDKYLKIDCVRQNHLIFIQSSCLYENLLFYPSTDIFDFSTNVISS